MAEQSLKPLIEHLETASRLDSGKVVEILDVVKRVLPEQAVWPETQTAMIHSTDEIIHMVDAAYPNWSIRLRGRASDKDGHWVCTLRRSDELDNDDMIGIGKAPVLAHAILAALLKLAELRS